MVFDFDPDIDEHRHGLDAARERLAQAGLSIELETLDQTIERGSRLAPVAEPASDDDRLAVIIYTSGSSGSPKGAMHSEGLAKSIWTVTARTLVGRGFAVPAITLNYTPMSHTGGRATLYTTLGAGGTAYFASSSDFSTMLSDLALVRPTQLNLVPRVWEMLYREFNRELETRGETAEDEVLDEMRTRVLGGRYITALTGSAPISADLAAWVEKLLDSRLMNALGATESGAVVIDGKVQCPPVTEYRLADVPELGYFGSDKPHPRGELLIKSRTLFDGYYKRPELTADVFDEQGFYRTGDVFAEVAPDTLRFVDRRNNVLKLSQGEFVTVSKLESLYVNCELVEQIYVYGNGERSYLLAVVVPTSEALEQYPAAELKVQIITALQKMAQAAQLEAYEIPRDIIVEPRPFTVDNGLLSGVRKLSRPNLGRQYNEQLEQLYSDRAVAETTELRELRRDGSLLPAIDVVCSVAGILLTSVRGRPSASASFTDLGGDSLSALEYAKELEQIFGFEVPVGVIVSPANDLQALADYVEKRRQSTYEGPTFGSVHAAGATKVRARELSLDKFLDDATLRGVRDLARPQSDVGTVLLTGATGYLGRYLLLDWLHRMHQVNGKVICLVRAKDVVTARDRLDRVFDSGDSSLLSLYRSLAGEHLEVLAGDKGEPALGLDEVTWQRLTDTVDLIVDPAAMVNHMLPYQELFGPNVLGTAELIRLALTTRQKPIAYVSTVGIGATIPIGEFTENADIRSIAGSRQLDDNYASGYATSKWAGEVLLREAHDLCGLPVAVFRCDMIMAETRFKGQLNVPDMVTRLILSIASTGLAPESFYQRETNGPRPKAHFDGLPVDFVAQSISALATNDGGGFEGFRTFHVVNPHDDDIGLDTFVDWMAEAGCRIRRIADYSLWFSRFESALRNLPERQRNSSVLPLLGSYRHPQPPIRGAFAPTEMFRAAVARANIGSNGQVPRLSRPIIEKYLSDLEHLGLLDREAESTTE